MTKRKIEKPRPKTEEEEQQPPVSPIVAEDSRTLQEQGRREILSDVQGSYTGTPADDLTPEQDPDDL